MTALEQANVASTGSAGTGRPGAARLFLYVLLAAGAVAAIARLVLGLGATTNLNDGYPWGLWVSFDVLTGVALAAGGFTLSAIVYVFNLKQFEPLLRPAKVSAFVGYAMFIVGLFLDIGLPWRLWHPLVMWNTHSVLFEVAWCVMLYTSVLALDILIMALEVLKRDDWVRFLKSIYVFLLVAGIILSTLHQSSLGALYLLVPEKMSDLWASRALGPLFYASAVIGGLSVVILETLISARAYRRDAHMKIVSSLAKGLAVALLVYFAMKVTDLYARGVGVWAFDGAHFLFFAELLGTIALPGVLLAFPEIRGSRSGLLWCSGLSAFGVVLNRFNVSLTAYGGYADFRYFPSVTEIVVTAALIGAAILAFDLAARYLPVYGRPLRSAGVPVPAGGEGRE
jgi:Ni/Fe-hydrogenase subunit HybB-like protein